MLSPCSPPSVCCVYAGRYDSRRKRVNHRKQEEAPSPSALATLDDRALDGAEEGLELCKVAVREVERMQLAAPDRRLRRPAVVLEHPTQRAELALVHVRRVQRHVAERGRL